MPTLYVENVPDELYQALKQRAKRERRSMAAEVIRILELNVPIAPDGEARGGDSAARREPDEVQI